MAEDATIPSALTVADLNTTVNHEPRIRDLRLAEALGMANIHAIRRIIKRHAKSLESFGELISHLDAKPSAEVSDLDRKLPQGGRPSRSYYLNKRQALYITAKSDTPRAAEITVRMVEIFDAHLAGRSVPAPAIQKRRELTAEERRAINRRAQLWSEADFVRYQSRLERYALPLLARGVSIEAILGDADRALDPSRIDQTPTPNDPEYSRLIATPGRYLVVVERGRIIEIRDVAGHCVLDPDNPVSMSTLVREYCALETLPDMAEWAVKRLARAALKQGGRS